MVEWLWPAELNAWIILLTGPLHGRHAWRLLPLLHGMLFACGRRTVASWLRAARRACKSDRAAGRGSTRTQVLPG